MYFSVWKFNLFYNNRHNQCYFFGVFGNSAENLAELDKHLAELAKDFITVS